MKYAFIPFLLLLLLSSCKKSDSGTTKPSKPNFVISGVRDADLSIVSSGKDTMNISIDPITPGIVDTVFLYANELPGDVYVSILPINGVTPFKAKVIVSASYKPGGGNYSIKINGAGHSGLCTYDTKVTLPEFRGWQLGSIVYQKDKLERDAANNLLRVY